MKAPEKWSPYQYAGYEWFELTVRVPATPTVYDDEPIRLVGPDGKPARKHPIGFGR